MTFHTVVQLDGKTATGLRVPEEVVLALGSGKRPAVRVSIGTYSYRSTIGSMSGVYMLPLSAENRKAAGVNAGDQVDVSLELDIEPRTVEVPEDLGSALAARPGAYEAFQALAFSKRKEFVRQVTEAKTQETRLRRIESGIAKLLEARD
jgi:hypothetical protein